MNAILKQVIRLGYLIRESEEGYTWRKSLEELDKIPLSTPNLFFLPPEKVSMVENLGLISKANRVRPLLLPLLVNKYTPHLSHNDIRKELSQDRKIWESYRPLELCSAFTGIVFTFLRAIAPGYPYADLIYTLPNTIWSELSSSKELPWDMASSLIPQGVNDAQQIGLDRAIPSAAPIIVVELNSLVNAIKSCETWIRLADAYKVIERQKSLKNELNRAREQYAQEIAVYRKPNISNPTWHIKSEALAEQVYMKRGKRIYNYVSCFLEYEWLIERIYWLLSQIIIFEHISCIASSIPQQIQQVSLSYGKEAYMTALAQTRGKTLAIGQLIHVTLPETDHFADGLYQIQSFRQEYKPKSGFHMLFHARCLWYCKLVPLLTVTEKYGQPIFLQNEEPSRINDTKINIMEGEEVIETLEAGQFLGYIINETMYLP